MNDPFEARVAAWLRDTARPEPEEVQRLFAFAGALPRRRSTRPIWLAEVGATAVLVTIAAVVAIDRLPFAPRPNGTPSYPIVSDDPRFAKCGGSPNRVIAAFPMQHAADYHAYIPRMGLAPELETPAPAFVVVFDQTHQWGLLPAPRPMRRTSSTSACGSATSQTGTLLVTAVWRSRGCARRSRARLSLYFRRPAILPSEAARQKRGRRPRCPAMPPSRWATERGPTSTEPGSGSPPSVR